MLLISRVLPAAKGNVMVPCELYSIVICEPQIKNRLMTGLFYVGGYAYS
jgi:hypothetical protein